MAAARRDVGSCVGRLRYFLALGMNSCCPYLSTPKAPATPWPLADRVQSSETWPAASFLAPLTTSTPYWLSSFLSPWTRIGSSRFFCMLRYVARSASVYAFFSLASFSVSPIPCPRDRYHGWPLGSMVADVQMDASLVYVPEVSPREANSALAFAILVKALTAEVSPLILAGSEAGPTMMKSLYMTS